MKGIKETKELSTFVTHSPFDGIYEHIITLETIQAALL